VSAYSNSSYSSPVTEDRPRQTERCDVSGEVGIGAGHECRCVGKAGHEPFSPDRAHGCSCGALW
jgi:hypothetical protein